jgi:hypothetical protein
MKRCETVWNPGRWPYTARCATKQSELHAIEVDGELWHVCDEHYAAWQQEQKRAK